MADSPQKCKENDKMMEKLSDPESVSNPQPPAIVKEETYNDYTDYNPELHLGLHSELDIKFEPDEEPQGHEGDEHDDDTGSAATIKIEIEIDVGEEINDLVEIQPKVEHIVPEADSPSGFKGMNTGYVPTVKIEIEEEANGFTETQTTLAHFATDPDAPSVFKETSTGASSSNTWKTTKSETHYRPKHNSKCKTDECIKKRDDNLIVTNKDLLDGKQQENIEQDNKRHSCKHSNKGYKDIGHSAERQYVCDVCKFYITTSKQNIICHIKKHYGEKPYACNICDKTFARKCDLPRHIRTHTGEKPYACKICDKKFIQQSNLNYHIKTHTGEKPYACKMCDKKFILQGNLNLHICTHTGEKPYACKLCDKKFIRPYYLNTHLRTCTGEKRYVCKLCDKKFTQKNLNKHIRTHTGVRSEPLNRSSFNQVKYYPACSEAPVRHLPRILRAAARQRSGGGAAAARERQD